MDLNFDGLMVETHPNPDKAWSDKEQQLTPAGLKNLFDRLIIREKSATSKKLKATLEELRELVDKRDEEMIRALKERMSVIEQIGIFKKENNIAVLQPERWNEIASTRTELAKEMGLSDEMVLKIFQLIHQESIREQTEILNRKKDEVTSG